MRFDILTLFPQMFSALDHSIVGRARSAKKIEINLIDFRKWSKCKHKKVDDTSYSGGAGLVLSAQPIVDCIEEIDPNHESHRIFLTPAAPTLTQQRVKELAGNHKRLTILCGHYEGVDQRAIDLCFDEVLSIGDYVLTGGEIPAMVLVDAVARYIDGVINAESLKDESFSLSLRGGGTTTKQSTQEDQPLLEAPHYTRPREFRGLHVPEVLFSGNHFEIEKWKKQASIEMTKKHRPKN
jgi:tRNA (guanine37-N1)-methyltransferase